MCQSMIHSNNGLLESPSPWQTIHHFTRQTINRANDDLYIGSAHYYTLGTFCKVILGGKGGGRKIGEKSMSSSPPYTVD